MLAISQVRFEAARAELDLLVADWLAEYLAKTPVINIPPRWIWTTGWSIHYRRTEQTIYIPEIYIKAYILSPAKTRRALRWALAHEYWHHVQWLRGGPFGIPIVDFPRAAEFFAGKHAAILSGVSDMEGEALTVEIIDLVMFYEGVAKESPVTEYRVRYIDLTTGTTEEKIISSMELDDFYREQREGKVSVIEIKAV